MKILVTGGAGFLGTHLCNSLVIAGHTVICMDNLMSGLRSNISELENNPIFSFIECDIRDTEAVSGCEQLKNLDQIYNLACPASPPFYQKDHVYTMQTSAKGIENMLDLAQKNNARILQASTSEVYGDPLEHPQVESYWGNVNTVGLRSCYDEGKRFAEAMMNSYHIQYGTDIRIARIFNSYGPLMRLDDGRVITNFIVQALRGDDITIYGDGSQTRSFCYCKDTIDGIIAIMNMNEYAGPINVGNQNEVSVLDVAKKIKSMTASKSKIICKDLPSDDPKLRCPDIAKIAKLTEWSPQVNFEEGLDNTIQYVKNLLN